MLNHDGQPLRGLSPGTAPPRPPRTGACPPQARKAAGKAKRGQRGRTPHCSPTVTCRAGKQRRPPSTSVLPEGAEVPRGQAVRSGLRLTGGATGLCRAAASERAPAEPGTSGRRSRRLRQGAGRNHSPRGDTARARQAGRGGQALPHRYVRGEHLTRGGRCPRSGAGGSGSWSQPHRAVGLPPPFAVGAARAVSLPEDASRGPSNGACSAAPSLARERPPLGAGALPSGPAAAAGPSQPHRPAAGPGHGGQRLTESAAGRLRGAAVGREGLSPWPGITERASP